MEAKENGDLLKKYLFWIMLALLLFMSYLILKPYLIALISAFILAYLINPVYLFFNKSMSKYLSALLCVFTILLVAILTVLFILTNVINQAYEALTLPQLKEFLTEISSYKLFETLNFNLSSMINKLVEFIISLISSTLVYLPSLLISLAITLIGVYFILTNWTLLQQKIKNFFPLKNKNKIIKEIGKTTDGIVYGYILIAIIEFIIAAIGFYLVGIKLYFLLAIMIFFLSFIPFIGPIFVWVPLAIYHLTLQNNTIAIGVILIGLVLSALIDGLLKMKITGDKTKINPFIMLLGVLGGVSLFGIFGFIIGPIILSYTIKLVQESIK